MTELVTVRNRLNGGIVRNYPRDLAEHELFGKHLEIVPDGTKPNVPLTVLVDKKRPKTEQARPARVAEEDDK